MAGGANFPGGGRPSTGGVKTWYDKIFVLERPNGEWKEAGRLPHPMGYGVSLSYGDGVVCLGGGNGSGNFSDAFVLRYTDGKVVVSSLPSMPEPLINGCGVIVGHSVYVVSENNFWCLDLSAAGRKWQVLRPLPGVSRILAAAGVYEGKVYVFGGVHMTSDPVPLRKYLKDCWEYTPGRGWKRIADLPHALAAAPSPAYNAGQNHLILFGGDDGALASQVAVLKDSHPGFTKDVLAYNILTDSWSVMGATPSPAPVTTPLVVWDGNIVIAGGEARPAVRTNQVLVASPRQPSGKFGGLDWTVIALYFAVVIGISVFVSKHMGSTTGDFFSAGRRYPGGLPV
ncbi:galactose oxidase [Puia sp. P3]|uniref:galactose oxidase n=1 Tax=Puia sp. P3 TaxID=3423952 RepID=UPI003D668C06